MTLNLQQRFLYLFADYRQAIENEQRHTDELLRLRGANEELSKQLAAERGISLQRERELSDRMLRHQLGDRIFSPVQPQTPRPEPAMPASDPMTVKRWQQQMNQKLQQDVMARQAANLPVILPVNGPAISSEN